ncbi:MAG: hypothetical protein CL910_02770 [Deltaproteobacteria bacterium]|nr:hypothetical protein [Deltaproteobacteria bacterium]
MTDSLAFSCEQHDSPFECPDALLYRSSTGQIGILIHDGGSSWMSIEYCPWCGAQLPEAAT